MDIGAKGSGRRTPGLFYAIAVAPQGDFPSYRRIFDRAIGSIQLID